MEVCVLEAEERSHSQRSYLKWWDHPHPYEPHAFESMRIPTPKAYSWQHFRPASEDIQAVTPSFGKAERLAQVPAKSRIWKTSFFVRKTCAELRRMCVDQNRSPAPRVPPQPERLHENLVRRLHAAKYSCKIPRKPNTRPAEIWAGSPGGICSVREGDLRRQCRG